MMALKTFAVGAFVCTALLASAFPAGDDDRMNEQELCRKLTDCYKNIQSVEAEKGKVYDIYVERLSFLVLAAGHRSSGSKNLDEILSRIQKDSPTLVVPRFVMTPAEMEKFLDSIAMDNADDLSYSAYRRKVRCISELIADAKMAITERSGFKFDPSVKVTRSQ